MLSSNAIELLDGGKALQQSRPLIYSPPLSHSRKSSFSPAYRFCRSNQTERPHSSPTPPPNPEHIFIANDFLPTLDLILPSIPTLPELPPSALPFPRPRPSLHAPLHVLLHDTELIPSPPSTEAAPRPAYCCDEDGQEDGRYERRDEDADECGEERDGRAVAAQS